MALDSDGRMFSHPSADGQLEAHTPKKVSDEWRQHYHVQPPLGSLDGLAGLVADAEGYQLFYEWTPVYGQRTKCLYHLTSKDMVAFDDQGVIKMLSDGDSPGSALVTDNQDGLHLFYTGLKSRRCIQYHSILDAQKEFKTTEAIIKGTPQGYLPVMNAPYVFHEDKYRMMLGTGTEDEFGRILVFSGDSPSSFQYDGPLATELDQFGFMWTHPEYFKLDGKDVLLFNVKGLDKYQNSYWNIYQSGYLVGDIDFNELHMTHGAFHELDHGFDFYAPKTVMSEGKRLIVGWMGTEETDYPTNGEWDHCLTIPREVSVRGSHLIQKPFDGLCNYRTNELTAEGYFDHYPRKIKDFYGHSYELVLDILENNANRIHIDLRVSRREHTSLIYDSESQVLTLDRTFSGKLPGNVDGTTRKVQLEAPLSQLDIFMDISSIEVFANHGEAVMSARIFPSNESTGVEFSTEIGGCHVRMARYDIKPTNDN
ncbi:sucrose-6-phosphate hydrolase [Salinicoccus jeotgali]|uniref:beta-fructofuranosidase n=1 Tax=Salinicoccus jeotgali TaxID=381634 RepID=A0ABP7F1V6_9STAP